MSAEPLFHFFAITQTSGREQKVVRIRTTQSLQSELTKLFEQQAEDFLDRDVEEVSFDGSYKVDDHEIFVIDNFPLINSLSSASKHPNQFEDIALDSETTPTIKSILAAAYNRSDDKPTVYFQAFSRSQLLVKSRLTILHSSTTFHKLTEEGLTLGTNLAAVFRNGKLYFRSFAIVNRFLDVKDYFKEATDEEIRGLVGHAVLVAEDIDKLTKDADSWMRKRFSALQNSGILDQIAARKTANKAEKFGLTIQIKKKDGKDAIIFPSDKKKAKQLLTFLNEGFYQGELTDRLYQTNSQRVLPKSN